MRIEIGPRVFAELLERKYFITLVRLSDGTYSILNDLNCIAIVDASCDDDAIKQFHYFLAEVLK